MAELPRQPGFRPAKPAPTDQRRLHRDRDHELRERGVDRPETHHVQQGSEFYTVVSVLNTGVMAVPVNIGSHGVRLSDLDEWR